MKTLARERDLGEILQRLKRIRSDSPRRWGRMSPHGMVCHLADSFRMVTGEKQVSAATGPLQRTVLKWVALYSPLPWPAGIATRPEIAQDVGGTSPLDFEADLAQLEALTGIFVSRAGKADRPQHPIFGRMSEAAWLRWAYLHMDHHLRQFGA